VLRTITVWPVFLRRKPAAISAVTASRAVKEGVPLGKLGVPTEIMEISVPSTASAASVVARRPPEAWAARTRSGTPASTMGDWPALIKSTLAGLVSTPTISWPSFARQTAETAPT